MDFEKIRLDAVSEIQSILTKDGRIPNQEAIVLIELASVATKEMLIKYHEALNESK